MTNAQNYIETVSDLYGLSKKDIDKMHNGIDQIEQELNQYLWDDIKYAIQVYYTRHNDKTRPRLSQILAILNTSKDVLKIPVNAEPVRRCLPQTTISEIQDTFNKMIELLIDCNVIPDIDGKFIGKKSLVARDDLPMLNPYQHLGWLVNDAERDNPQFYVGYQGASMLEKLAIGLHNKIITLKTRDWKKLARGVK